MDNFKENINEIKKRINDCFENKECSYSDLDFFLNHISKLESGFEDRSELETLNKIIENGYLKQNMYDNLFLFKKSIINLEQREENNQNLIPLEELYEELEKEKKEKPDKLDENWIIKISKTIKKIEPHIPIIKQSSPQIGEKLADNIKYINQILENKEDVDKIYNAITKISSKIGQYFENNPNAKKAVLTAGVVGLGIAGFMLGKKLIESYRDSKNFENDNILTIAYYLSRYEHDGLFNHPISFSKAVSIIAEWLSMKPNTLKNKRDYFDTIVEESKRKGYTNTNIPEKYYDIQNKLKNKNQSEIKIDVIKILNNARDGLG